MLPKALFTAIIAVPLAAALAVPEGAAARDLLPTSISRVHPTFTHSGPIPTGTGKGKGPHPSGTFSRRPHPSGSFTHRPPPPPSGVPTGVAARDDTLPSSVSRAHHTFSHRPHPTGVPSGIPSGFPTGKGKTRTHSAPPAPTKTPAN